MRSDNLDIAAQLRQVSPADSGRFEKAEVETVEVNPAATLNRAATLTPEVAAVIEDMFQYHPWNAEQTAKGIKVRAALQRAVEVIIENVPPSADRTVAIRKLRDARMDCNSAITHGGKY